MIRKYFTYATAFILCSCSYMNDDFPSEQGKPIGMIYNNVIAIDSSYTYYGDSLYNSMLLEYNTRLKTKALSPEDDAFFNKVHTVTSTEASLLYGKNYIYPGAVLEGNSIHDQKYVPVFLANRNPITVSMTLTHNSPKSTVREIINPSNSKLSDYVKDMVVDGNFSQNEKFMFQYKRFSFYDEIKSAFGTNIDTKKLFSSNKESSSELHEKILSSTGMYVKFYQSSFTVNMDIAPLSNQPVIGNSGFEPVYVSSVTYGRMGLIVFETEMSYEFAEKCIKKEFDRIFYDKTESLTEEERRFFESTEFKVLIIGSDSDYAVQTFKGYSHFLNLIYNSRFSEHSFGVPITCSYSYANSHALVETKFTVPIYIEPLYVKMTRENSNYYPGQGSDYSASADLYLSFYKDRAKTKQAYPYTDIIFNVTERVQELRYFPNYDNWPMIEIESIRDEETIHKMRNIKLQSRMSVGIETSSYTSDGPEPSFDEPMRVWEAREHHRQFYLQSSPFFLTIY